MIDKICEKYSIENYTINDDGSIDVNGNVYLWGKNLTELPLTFNRVSGYFTCGGNKLTTLKECPRWVGGYFDCSNNQLTTLKGCPRWVGGNFYCYDNQLTSLEFSPDYVGGDFECYNNQLTDNYCDTEIKAGFHTSLEQDGLVVDNLNRSTNYNEWRKLIKRKQTLNELYTRYM